LQQKSLANCLAVFVKVTVVYEFKGCGRTDGFALNTVVPFGTEQESCWQNMSSFS
jgi:hypothetical protein